MKTYKFFLVSYKRQKTVTVRAVTSTRAREIVSEQAPGWEVSMFWNVWP